MSRLPERCRGLAAVLAIAWLSACTNVESPLNPVPQQVVDLSPRTIAFSSVVAVKGVSTRSFRVLQDGVVTLTLISAGPPSTVSIGFGVGVPRPDGTGCNLGRVVIAQAGTSPQLSVNVDAGLYCIGVYDPGTLLDAVSFSLSIYHT
jgi:hypothetical protein